MRVLVYFLKILREHGDGSVGMGVSGWEHGDGSVGMGAWGRELGMGASTLQHRDGSMGTGAWGQKRGDGRKICHVYVSNPLIFFTLAWKRGPGE